VFQGFSIFQLDDVLIMVPEVCPGFVIDIRACRRFLWLFKRCSGHDFFKSSRFGGGFD
jgi:hypothetical protein